MKPPFAYFGGKTGMARSIVSMMPTHRVYMEPFFGSGAVLFAKTPATHEIVNDLDGDIVTFFRVLREQPEQLELACSLTPHARDEFSAAYTPGEHPEDDLERARRLWVRINQSFAKTAGNRTGWSNTTARTQSIPMSIRGRIARFADCAERLSRVTIENCDAAGLVERLATADTVIYADPPYLAASRVARTGGANDYAHDMGSEDEHRRLAKVLNETPATVLLSGYPSPLYDELYEGWEFFDTACRAHSSNAATNKRGSRTERIWSNRPISLAGKLFDE